MQVWHKVVSVSLVLMALLAPSTALAFCVPDSAGQMESMQCPPDCPMMAGMQSHDGGNELSSTSTPPCCTIKSSKSAPITESSVVSPIVAIEPVFAAAVFTPVATPQTADEADTSPPPIVGIQSRLCTFLI